VQVLAHSTNKDVMMKEFCIVTLLFIVAACVIAKTASKNSAEVLIGKPAYEFLTK
jgi:hypothetical protein